MEEQNKWETINITDFNFIGTQRINEKNGISVNKNLIDKIILFFSEVRKNGITNKEDIIKIEIKNNVKERVLVPEDVKGFVSITLISILSVLLIGFGIFKLIGTMMFK